MIWHIALARDWDSALADGRYPWSTLGQTVDEVGYVHASGSADQVVRVARFVYRDMTEPLVLLHLDEDALAAAGCEVRLEPGDPSDPHSEHFPHIHGGAVPMSAVCLAEPFGDVDHLVESLRQRHDDIPDPERGEHR